MITCVVIKADVIKCKLHRIWRIFNALINCLAEGTSLKKNILLPYDDSLGTSLQLGLIQYLAMPQKGCLGNWGELQSKRGLGSVEFNTPTFKLQALCSLFPEPHYF